MLIPRWAQITGYHPTRCWPVAVWMLVQRLRRWTNVQPAAGQRLVFAGRSSVICLRRWLVDPSASSSSLRVSGPCWYLLFLRWFQFRGFVGLRLTYGEAVHTGVDNNTSLWLLCQQQQKYYKQTNKKQYERQPKYIIVHQALVVHVACPRSPSH